jgi:hypothetical protein
MRALLSILVIALAAGPAAADPPAVPVQKQPPTKKKPAATAKATATAKAKPAAAPGVNLGSMARAATAPGSAEANDARTPNGARRLDLSPARLFGHGMGKTDRRGAERGSGTSLGDDGSWAVQAAQVGVMAVGFAALWALCGGGNCMLPDVLPDAFSTPEGLPPDLEIRPHNEPRSAR